MIVGARNSHTRRTDPPGSGHAAAASRLPPEVVAVFASDQAALAAGGVRAGAVSVGDRLAPFALPDATGQTRTLDELTADRPPSSSSTEAAGARTAT